MPINQCKGAKVYMIPEDGGEPVELTDISDIEMEDVLPDLLDPDAIGKALVDLLDTGKTFTIKIDISNKFHLSRKRFKKLLMGKGISRDEAEILCASIECWKGKESYRDIFLESMFLKSEVTFFDVWRAIFKRNFKDICDYTVKEKEN